MYVSALKVVYGFEMWLSIRLAGGERQSTGLLKSFRIFRVNRKNERNQKERKKKGIVLKEKKFKKRERILSGTEKREN